ncbi:hypothetical protein QR680_003903 [Steinernema hermaphroditum]|uniref:Uncharacterized protein n=1 Tax=Steinernema hermaphroditum TaxID=289476 RepID=A0AA39HM10_9BILA|nr:hypothetical protein QR680_003903 [Steinernema hermaphroditum]
MSHLTMIHHLLPKEMETIVKPFDWNAAAREDHQVELYLLDIDVYISEDKQIHLSVKKRLSNEQSAGPRSHVSVDFDWIDSKIWKLQNGMDVAHCLDEVVLDSEKDWMEMVEWYGPVEVKTKSGYQVLQLDVHPDLISLEIENRGSHVAFTTKRTIMDNPMLKSLLFRWKVEGNGDYIINGRQKVVLLVEESAWNRLRGSKSGRVVVHHPTMNRRLLLEVEMNYSWGVAVRFSVLGIDTEAVTDWNLNLLFKEKSKWWRGVLPALLCPFVNILTSVSHNSQ